MCGADLEVIKCKECSKWFKNKRGYNIHYNRMHVCNHKQKEISPSFDFNLIKQFITSEIQKALKMFNFNIPTIKKNDINTGILPIKSAKKIPSFTPFEANKRLVIKELKEQLKKGINDVLQKVGSFDEQINFLETPIEVLV